MDTTQPLTADRHGPGNSLRQFWKTRTRMFHRSKWPESVQTPDGVRLVWHHATYRRPKAA